jgi:hypothetical protein
MTLKIEWLHEAEKLRTSPLKWLHDLAGSMGLKKSPVEWLHEGENRHPKLFGQVEPH